MQLDVPKLVITTLILEQFIAADFSLRIINQYHNGDYYAETVTLNVLDLRSHDSETKLSQSFSRFASRYSHRVSSTNPFRQIIITRAKWWMASMGEERDLADVEG